MLWGWGSKPRNPIPVWARCSLNLGRDNGYPARCGSLEGAISGVVSPRSWLQTGGLSQNILVFRTGQTIVIKYLVDTIPNLLCSCAGRPFKPAAGQHTEVVVSARQCSSWGRGGMLSIRAWCAARSRGGVALWQTTLRVRYGPNNLETALFEFEWHIVLSEGMRGIRGIKYVSPFSEPMRFASISVCNLY
ncbi:hypothetical protein AVEN_177424-1 [Araneus ventricosus]|uniref:Uncharacterized protein n=1 Tax=Araneus ventricosus TaxID=182803 RepID=A0A4Y2IQD9_ARAVE|nr:hypothetical protein AVEN_177424-1 [Araneus ventricosus]